MLAQLLNPTLFGSPEETLEHRYRLNTLMFRRTKAEACQPDGSPLFARWWVHTESFLTNEAERRFYEKLRAYLEDRFDLARRQGGPGRALRFLIAIFQKIAASSFAAVRRTLKRRLLMLTLHEALLRDKDLDIAGALIIISPTLFSPDVAAPLQNMVLRAQTHMGRPAFGEFVIKAHRGPRAPDRRGPGTDP